MAKTNAIPVTSPKQADNTANPVSAQQTKNPKFNRRTRELDEIAPFLHQVEKIVSEECAKHKTVANIPWYKTWESWMDQNLLLKTSMNSVPTIIVPDLFYNERTIKAIVERCIDEIHPITSYIDITHLTDKSVSWIPRVDIGSFQSVRKRSHNPKKAENVDKYCRLFNPALASQGRSAVGPGRPQLRRQTSFCDTSPSRGLGMRKLSTFLRTIVRILITTTTTTTTKYFTFELLRLFVCS